MATPEEAEEPLWRGVRGVLPNTFWVPDEQGIVCAVDMGFMSTSRNRRTPINYMAGEGMENVLWCLQCGRTIKTRRNCVFTAPFTHPWSAVASRELGSPHSTTV